MKYFRNIGLIAILFFSFFYTEKIANWTLKNNEIYKTIESVKDDYRVASIDAMINGDSIVPGLNGLEVSVKDSYYNMKDIDIFNAYYLIYDVTFPKISVDANVDKIINRGNSLKNSVSFVLEYNEELINFFKNSGYDASILVDINTFQKDETLEQINNDSKHFNGLESLINKYSTNSNICYLNSTNETICRENKKYLIKSEKILNNSTFIDVKNNINSGDIYYVDKNMDVKNMQIVINSILYKDLDIVRLSKLISEERD